MLPADNPFRSVRCLSLWPSFLRDVALSTLIVALAGYSALQSRAHFEQQAQVTADNLSQVLGDRIGSAIERIDLVLKTVARDVSQQQARGEIKRHDLELLLVQQHQLLPDAKDLLIADRDGVFTFGADVPPGFRIDISGLDYFRRLKDDPQAGLVIGGPYQDPFDRQWVIVFARRITGADGAFAGIVSSAISAEHFRAMLSFLNLGPHGMVVLRTGDMSAVARYPQLPDGDVIGSKAIAHEFETSLRANPEHGIFLARSLSDQVERMSSYRMVAGLPLYIVVGLATEDYLSPWWDEVAQLSGIVGAFMLITLWLSRAAQRVAGRQRAISRLLDEAVENIAIGFAIFDPRDQLIVCNQATRRIFPGLRDCLRPGSQFADILRSMAMKGMFPEALADIDNWVQERLRQHQVADGRHFEVKMRDDSELMVVERRTPSGHTVVNLIEITELSQYRRHLERLVEERTTELKTALDQFRILIELSPTALAMFDKDLRYIAASRRWLEAHGPGDGAFMGMPIYTAHPDLPEHWKAALRAALGGVPDSMEEDLWIRHDGSRRWLRWAVHPWVAPRGGIGGIVVSTEDITQRKEAELALAEERQTGQRLLEERVAQRTAELEAANRQLEGFLFAASHDLRGPLGRISSFSTLLERKCKDRLEGEGIMFLNFIRENALRLNRLIDDLLAHAQIDQQTLRLQPLILGDAVTACLQEMAVDIRESGAAVTVTLPSASVLADPHGLNQVLHNLLENALKYSTPSAHPAIEVGGAQIEDRFRCWIRDNGIGFDMEYHDRIFELFGRLHAYSEFAGTGVGLTLVKRAMERMGGKVWGESEPGQGATFFLEFACPVE